MSEQGNEGKKDNILAFVCDPISAQTLGNTLKALNIPDCRVIIGDTVAVREHLLVNRSPRILLVDLSNAELPLNEIQILSEIYEPGCYVITIGTRNDIRLYRDLVKLGVSDYIIKPLNADVMSQALLRLIEGEDMSADMMRSGKIISFIGSRGGAGCTTMATNVAWYMSMEKHKRVMLIDGNLHNGSVSLYLDCNDDAHFKDLIAKADFVDEVYVEHASIKHSERLMIMSAREDFTNAADTDYRALEKILNILKLQQHFILIDVPRTFDAMTRHALDMSAMIVIVTDLSLAGVRDTARLMELIDPEKAQTKVIIVANKVGMYSRGEISVEAFAKSVGHTVDYVVPFDSDNAMIAANVGAPLLSMRSVVNEHVQKIADHLMGDVHYKPIPSFIETVQEALDNFERFYETTDWDELKDELKASLKDSLVKAVKKRS